MGRILTPALLKQRAAEAEAISGVAGYMPHHGADDGECFAMLHETRVLVRYELTSIGVEVDQVCINGAVIPGGHFDAETRREWERDIQRSRDEAGYTQ